VPAKNLGADARSQVRFINDSAPDYMGVNPDDFSVAMHDLGHWKSRWSNKSYLDQNSCAWIGRFLPEIAVSLFHH